MQTFTIILIIYLLSIQLCGWQLTRASLRPKLRKKLEQYEPHMRETAFTIIQFTPCLNTFMCFLYISNWVLYKIRGYE